jgi:hypothetical protein
MVEENSRYARENPVPFGAAEEGSLTYSGDMPVERRCKGYKCRSIWEMSLTLFTKLGSYTRMEKSMMD